jgi:hypothetical protein
MRNNFNDIFEHFINFYFAFCFNIFNEFSNNLILSFINGNCKKVQRFNFDGIFLLI